MLRDSFYGFGLVSKILNITIIVLIILMYLSVIFDQFIVTSVWYHNYLGFSLLLLIVLIVKAFWFCFNQKPMSIAMTRAGAIILRINLLLIFFTLLVIIISGFWEHIFDCYFQYLINVNNKHDFNIFGFRLIPFSIIQLVGYLLETYMNWDIIYIRGILKKVWLSLFLGVLPILFITYGVQVIINRKLYKRNTPEILS